MHSNKERSPKGGLISKGRRDMDDSCFLFTQCLLPRYLEDIRCRKQHGESVTQLSLTELVLYTFFHPRAIRQLPPPAFVQDSTAEEGDGYGVCNTAPLLFPISFSCDSLKQDT